MRFPRRPAILAAIALCSAPLAAQQIGGGLTELRRAYGPMPSDNWGARVAWLGDTTGDGRDDYAIGNSRDEGPVRVYSGISGALQHVLVPAQEVRRAGDVDGDGVADLALSDDQSFFGVNGRGEVWIYSGATGALIRTLRGEDFSVYGLGTSIDGVGDLDGDGRADLAVGAADHPLGVQNGRVYVYSGADGSVLHQWDGAAPGDRLGTQVRGVGDADGDGVPDVLLASRYVEHPSGGAYGGVELRSGADGSLLWSTYGSPSADRFGTSVSAAGDVDGDGRADVLVGAPGAGTGRVVLLSGADGSLLRSYAGPLQATGTATRFGNAVSGGRDLDGDLVPDHGFFCIPQGTTGGRTYLYSGATGAEIGVLRGRPRDQGLGQALDMDGDVDGDGLADILLGSELADHPPRFNYGVYSIRTLNPYLYTSSSEVSVSAGPPLELRLKFPASEGGRRYLLLASPAGHGATVVGGAVIPLADDPLLQQLLAGQIPRPLNGAAGTLDQAGRAAASLTVNPRATGAVGQSLTFCAVTLDSATLSVRRFSTARKVEFVP